MKAPIKEMTEFDKRWKCTYTVKFEKAFEYKCKKYAAGEHTFSFTKKMHKGDAFDESYDNLFIKFGLIKNGHYVKEKSPLCPMPTPKNIQLLPV